MIYAVYNSNGKMKVLRWNNRTKLKDFVNSLKAGKRFTANATVDELLEFIAATGNYRNLQRVTAEDLTQEEKQSAESPSP